MFIFLLVAVGLLGSPFLNYTQSSASINWADIHGVQYRWSPLMTEDNVTNKAPPPSISFPQIEANGWNEVRVYISWSWYEANQSAFLNYLQELATEADKTNLNVVYSACGTGGVQQSWPNGCFPSYLENQYASVAAFWNAWLANEVRYQGASGWDLQVQFMKAVIGVVDAHASTLAYEIMNEPKTPNYQYTNLSAYQTYVAQHLRQITSNWIMFMGPYNGGHVPGNSPPIQSAPSLSITKLVFDGHDYQNGAYIPTIAQVSSTLHVPGIVGEFAVCNSSVTCSTTQSGASVAISNYLTLFEKYGLGWDYYSWAYGPANQSGYYQNLLDYSANQWWLDSLLVVHSSVSGTTSLATSTAITTSVSKSSTSTLTSTISSTSSTVVSSSSSLTTKTTTITTTTSLTTTGGTSSSTQTSSSFSCTSPATATKSGVTVAISSNCFHVGDLLTGVVTGLPSNQAYRVYDMNGNTVVEKAYFNSNSSGDLTFSLDILPSMLTNSNPTYNWIHFMLNNSPWSQAIAIKIQVSS